MDAKIWSTLNERDESFVPTKAKQPSLSRPMSGHLTTSRSYYADEDVETVEFQSVWSKIIDFLKEWLPKLSIFKQFTGIFHRRRQHFVPCISVFISMLVVLILCFELYA